MKNRILLGNDFSVFHSFTKWRLAYLIKKCFIIWFVWKSFYLFSAIQCPPPLPPKNGRLLDTGHYLVGNTVQYFCKEGFVLIGEPVIRCTESGLWSHAPPFCKFKYILSGIFVFKYISTYSSNNALLIPISLEVG